jgi:hypothetical protein
MEVCKDYLNYNYYTKQHILVTMIHINFNNLAYKCFQILKKNNVKKKKLY